MSRDTLCYLNGTFLPKSQATLPVEDRGILFGEAIYEVFRYYNGRPFHAQPHMDRLKRSLTNAHIPLPSEFDQLTSICNKLVAQNNLPSSLIYIHITRGTAPRPQRTYDNLTPTVLIMNYPTAPFDPAAPMPTKTLSLLPDLRWLSCDTKTAMLMPNIAATNRSLTQGTQDALLHRDNIVTESTASNVFAVHNGTIYTHPANHLILHGITRAAVIQLAQQNNIPLIESPFAVEQCLAADELFITGTSSHVTAVTRVDDRTIGNLTPNTTPAQAYPIAQRLYDLFAELVQKQTDPQPATPQKA